MYDKKKLVTPLSKIVLLFFSSQQQSRCDNIKISQIKSKNVAL